MDFLSLCNRMVLSQITREALFKYELTRFALDRPVNFTASANKTEHRRARNEKKTVRDDFADETGGGTRGDKNKLTLFEMKCHGNWNTSFWSPASREAGSSRLSPERM